MNTSRLPHCCIVFAFLAPAFAHGITLTGSIYEGFNYTTTNNGADNTSDGDLGGNTGGTGWGATPLEWSNSGTAANTSTVLNIAPLGLTYPGLESSGGALNLNALAPVGGTANTTQNFFRLLNQGGAIDSGTFYFSLLLENDSPSQRTINFAFFGANSEKFAVGQFSPAATASNGNIALTQLNAAPVQIGTPPIPLGQDITHLLVGRVDFNVSGTTDRLRLYVDPVLDGSGEPASAYIDVATVDFGSIDQVRPFVGNTTTTPAHTASIGTFDEIRLGPSYAAVTVPEPGSASLILLTASGLALRRKRRP